MAPEELAERRISAARRLCGALTAPALRRPSRGHHGQHLPEGADDVVLVLRREARRDGNQHAALEQCVRRRARTLGVVAAQTDVLSHAPREAAGVHARAHLQTGDVVVEVQSPLCHHDVRDALRPGANSLRPQRVAHPPRGLSVAIGGDEEAARIARRIHEPAQPHRLEALQRRANAVLARAHGGNGLRQPAQLHAQHRGAHFVHAVAAAPDLQTRIVQNQPPGLVARVAQVVRGERAAVEPLVIGHHAPAFPGRHILVDLETEGGDVAEGAHAPACHRAARALRAVFEQPQALLLRDGLDRFHVARRAAHVDHHDAGGLGRDAPLQVARVQAKSIVDIGQHGDGAVIDSRAGHGDPHVGGHDDLLPRPHPQRRKRHVQRARAARHADGMPRAVEFGEVRLEGLRFPLPVRTVIAKGRFRAQHARHGLDFLLAHPRQAGKLQRKRFRAHRRAALDSQLFFAHLPASITRSGAARDLAGPAGCVSMVSSA